MKKTLYVLALVVASIGIAAPPAQADSRGCVTKTEYRHVHRGMTKGRVHHIFDTQGHRDAIAGSGRRLIEVRSYRTCRRSGGVSVSYRRHRVSAKFAVWGD
jgi:hypothetical protein